MVEVVRQGDHHVSHPDEERAGVEDIIGDYNVYARAARRLAEEHFDSDVVPPRLLANLGVA